MLDSIEGPLYDALVALVATDSIGIDAARRATRGAATVQVVRELSARLPLVTLVDGNCKIHPLISSIVLTTAGPEIEQYRLIAAESYEQDGRLTEAACMYLDGGMASGGARCLEGTVGPFLERSAWAGLDELAERLPDRDTPELPTPLGDARMGSPRRRRHGRPHRRRNGAPRNASFRSSITGGKTGQLAPDLAAEPALRSRFGRTHSSRTIRWTKTIFLRATSPC